MIWFFTRDSAQIDLEVHRLPHGDGYVFSVTQSDGSERAERFKDPGRLVTRVLSVQQKLLEDGWMPASPVGGRVVVRPPSRRRRPKYIVLARRAVSRFHRSVTRRLAAAFGL
jgi:hypothetical protein